MRALLLAPVVAVLLVGAACSDDGDPKPAATSTTSSTVATTSSTSTTVALTAFPPARETLSHGGSTWAVVLAGSQDNDARELKAAERAAAEAGYVAEATDCDVKADDVLGMTDDAHHFTVSVYFETEAQARQALKAFEERGVKGAAMGQVETYCMD